MERLQNNVLLHTSLDSNDMLQEMLLTFISQYDHDASGWATPAEIRSALASAANEKLGLSQVSQIHSHTENFGPFEWQGKPVFGVCSLVGCCNMWPWRKLPISVQVGFAEVHFAG